MIEEPLQFGGAPHRLRGWLLLLLHEHARAGLGEISQERLHLLLFYSAVLTPVHGLDQPVPKILKLGNRPFYPEAQEQLERLVVGGFVETGQRESIADDGWNNAYRATADGLRVTALLRDSRWGERTAAFVRDLVSSFAELEPAGADRIIDEDATFRDDRMRVDEIRDIRKVNQALEAARLVADYEVDDVRPAARDSIALYFDFLQARRAA